MIGTLTKNLTREQVEIIRAVLYFDVFKYPLTIHELYENAAIRIKKEEYLDELNVLIDQGLLKKQDSFILTPERDSEAIKRRQAGNAGAVEIMPTALKYSKTIASFPFVDAVFLSGALSKNYYDEKGDIDFFIVTKPNRLWICRSLLIIRYKLLPKSKKKFWCVNYFVSSEELTIRDVNIFTGTELAYLIPTVNYPVYKHLLESNSWYKDRFPNKNPLEDVNCINPPQHPLKSFFEFILGGALGEWVDNTMLRLTLNRWRKKYPELSSEDFELQFRSRKNVCKRHTKGFQNKILKLWEEKQNLFEEQHQVSLR